MLPNPQQPPKSQTLEYLKVIGPIGVAILAAFQKQGAPFWALLGFAVLMLVVLFYGPTARTVTARRHRKHDDRVALVAIRGFQRLVRRFQEFVDESQSRDTLRMIVQNAFQSDQATLERLRLPSTHTLRSLVLELLERLRDEPTGLRYLIRVAGEFHTIVNAYSEGTLEPLFKNLKTSDQQTLNAACGRQVEAFRQRYMGFRDDYEKFMKEVLSELQSTPLLYGDFPRAEPLLGVLAPAASQKP